MKKVIALLLVSVLGLQLIACSKTKTNNSDNESNASLPSEVNLTDIDDVSAGQIYFTANKMIIEPIGDEEFNSCQSEFVTADEEGVIWSRELEQRSEDTNSFDIYKRIYRISKYSYDGSLISCIDINADEYPFVKAFAVGDEVYLAKTYWESDTGIMHSVISKCDFATGEQVDQNQTELTNLVKDYTTVIVDSIKVGDRNVLVANDSDMGLALIYVNDDLTYEKKVLGYVLKNTYNVTDGVVFSISDSEVLIYSGSRCITYNIDTNEYSEITEPGVLATSKYQFFSLNSRLYLISEFGIDMYVPEDNSTITIVDYATCNVNLYDMKLVRPAYINANSIIVINSFWDISENLFFYKLDTTSTNPLDGKNVIDVVDMRGYISPFVAEAVYEFNNSHDDIYISISDQYALNNVISLYDNYGVSLDNYEAGQLTTDALLMDLISGDGPDIILNGYEYTQFNSDNCLIKLNDYICGDTSLNPDDFYSAVLDGDIYQMPIEVGLIGLGYWPKTEPVTSNNGFTYDEYTNFISNIDNNGFDPLSLVFDRANYFAFLFNYMNDLYITDGKIDLDNDAFRAMAEYCKELPEKVVKDNTIYKDEYGNTYMEYNYECRYGATMKFGDTNAMLLGFPSYDGRGPVLDVITSVGITTSCSDVDSAWEFVSYLLSDDIQYMTSYGNSCTMVNKQVFEEAAVDYIAWMKEIYESHGDVYTLDESYIAKWEQMVEDAVLVHDVDPAIMVIMYEEIQSYFVGDKTLDEIIPIIEDRCQTVMDERS